MLASALAFLLVHALPQAPANETLPITVLYAGDADTPYGAAWQRFLGAHVMRVKSIARAELKREHLNGFDLLVVDGDPSGKQARLTLDDLQGFPVVLMGGQGGHLADDLHLKTSWHYG